MDLLDAIVIAWMLCHCERARRLESLRLRAIQRLVAQYRPGHRTGRHRRTSCWGILPGH